MDQPCTYAELQACLRDIARINRLTLAYRPTLAWLDRLPRQASGVLHIVDVGCGYGDMLRRVHTWGAERGIPVRLTGIDLNGDAIRAAREATTQDQEIDWIHGDAFSYVASQRADRQEVNVVISSLLMHHLEEPEIIHFMRWMEATALGGWFINDLHRMKTPYRAFRLLAWLLPLHRFVRKDGLVSIRRSFRAEDWRRLCLAAGMSLKDVMVEEHRPARLCVGRVKV